MDLLEYQCFGTTPTTGSHALLVSGPEIVNWSAEERHAFTIDHKAHACVFVGYDSTGSASLDFYYPHMRSPLCVHASLAAAHFLSRNADKHATVSAVTAMKQQSLHFHRQQDDLFVSIDPASVTQPKVVREQIAALLRCDIGALSGRLEAASVGSPKLLVEVASAHVLRSLRPDLEGVVAWGRAHGVNGFYVYTPTGDCEFEGRNFNHLHEHDEDTATGVAAGALGCMLGHGLTLRQGEVQGNPCVLRTSMSHGKVQVGGRVTRLSR